MPLRRIGDVPSNFNDKPLICQHPEHDPPSMMVLDDGFYEYECPGCGRRTHFTLTKPFLHLFRPMM